MGKESSVKGILEAEEKKGMEKKMVGVDCGSKENVAGSCSQTSHGSWWENSSMKGMWREGEEEEKEVKMPMVFIGGRSG